MTEHGKHRKRRRGCHKRATSPEVKAWEAEHRPEPAPPWMDAETAQRLREVRRELESARLG